MTTSNVSNFLKSRYDPVNNRTIFYNKDNRVARVLSLLDEQPEKATALDIGCYDGEIALKIKKRLGAACDMYGIDVADNVQDECTKKGIKYRVNDLNEGIFFEDSFFDYVFAGEIIEHIYDTDFFMDEIKRVLKPEGTLILTTPNLVSLGRRIHFFLGKSTFMEASLTFPQGAAGHIRFFTKQLLFDYLRYRGFNIEKFVSDEVNFPRYRSTLLARLFPTLGHHLIVKARPL